MSYKSKDVVVSLLLQ